MKIQTGAVAKSYMRKDFLIYETLRKYFPIYEEAVSHIWLRNCTILNFLIYEENLIFFIISVLCRCMGIAWFSDGSDCGEDKGLGTNLEMELTDILSPQGCIFHKLVNRVDSRSIYIFRHQISERKSILSYRGLSISNTPGVEGCGSNWDWPPLRKVVGNFRMCKHIKDSEKTNINPWITHETADTNLRTQVL